jgi:hypothetical protein
MLQKRLDFCREAKANAQIQRIKDRNREIRRSHEDSAEAHSFLPINV